MKCLNCGAELELDARFCTTCGSKVEAPVVEPETVTEQPVTEQPVAEQPVTEQPVYEQRVYQQPEAEQPKKGIAFDPAALTGKMGGKKPMDKKLIGLCVGTLFILIGLIRVLTAGTSISSTSFGADFYTYTYQGIVAISELLASIEASLGWLIAAVGAAIDVIALRD